MDLEVAGVEGLGAKLVLVKNICVFDWALTQLPMHFGCSNYGSIHGIHHELEV
jgi:hypothetical protein